MRHIPFNICMMKGIAGATEEDKVVMKNRFRPVSPLLAALSRGACVHGFKNCLKRRRDEDGADAAARPCYSSTGRLWSRWSLFCCKTRGPTLQRSETIWLSSSSSSAVILLYSQRGQSFGSIAAPLVAEREHRPSLPLLSQIYPLWCHLGIGWGVGATTLRSLTARPGYCWNCSIDLTISVSIPCFQYSSRTILLIFCPDYFFFVLWRFSLSLTDNKNAINVAAQNILFSIFTGDSNQDFLQINNFTNANFHNQLTPKFASFSSSSLCYVKTCQPATSEP